MVVAAMFAALPSARFASVTRIASRPNYQEGCERDVRRALLEEHTRVGVAGGDRSRANVACILGGVRITEAIRATLTSHAAQAP